MIIVAKSMVTLASGEEVKCVSVGLTADDLGELVATNEACIYVKSLDTIIRIVTDITSGDVLAMMYKNDLRITSVIEELDQNGN